MHGGNKNLLSIRNSTTNECRQAGTQCYWILRRASFLESGLGDLETRATLMDQSDRSTHAKHQGTLVSGHQMIVLCAHPAFPV